MNSLYVLAEGSRTEQILLAAWLPQLLPGIRKIVRPEDAHGAYGFYLISGDGYPSILDRIEAAIEDVGVFDGFGRLIVVLDSEEQTVAEVRHQVETEIGKFDCRVAFHVVVADCAVESWLLGNRKFVKRNPSGERLVGFRREYDVTVDDPELMPNLRPAQFNTRAQYHKAYLRAAYSEHRLKYSENRPTPAPSPDYLEELIKRANAPENPKHLRSFQTLVDVIKLHHDSMSGNV